MLERINDQAEIIKMLTNTKHNNRLSHAYLFHGPKGVGKMDVAKYFALMEYCSNEVPCMTCDSCKQILDDSHMNVRIIEPIGQGIKKEQILLLQEEFSKTSLVKGARIYIINHIDKISLSAANSLLKFIEEPPSDNTYAILLTENKNMVLPTIISRCADVSFKPLKKETIIDLLISDGLDKQTANILSYLTNNPEQYKDYLESDIIDVFISFIEAKTSKDASLFILDNNKFLYDRDNLRLLFKLIIVLYEDLFKLEYDDKEISLYTLKNKIVKYKKIYTHNQLKENLEMILDLNTRLGSNTIPKNIINNLMLNLF